MEHSTDTAGVHFVAPYFLNPLHPIRVDLIGAGGNGSQMFSCLARINHALVALGGKGLSVRVFDPDTVEEPNIGRQLFCEAELGYNKAVALVTRFNRFYGTHWDGIPDRWRPDAPRECRPNMIISCVDSLSSRKDVARVMAGTVGEDAPEYRTYYWLDLGNARRSGQAILGSAEIPQPKIEGVRTVSHLPLFSEEYDIEAIDESDSGPSCSMAEALARQDLFVNSVLVQGAASLLWSLLREDHVEHRGFYLNLETLSMAPMGI